MGYLGRRGIRHHRISLNVIAKAGVPFVSKIAQSPYNKVILGICGVAVLVAMDVVDLVGVS
jgi:hypothetical protein